MCDLTACRRQAVRLVGLYLWCFVVDQTIASWNRVGCGCGNSTPSVDLMSRISFKASRGVSQHSGLRLACVTASTSICRSCVFRVTVWDG
jgi:hypothetical protein